MLPVQGNIYMLVGAGGNITVQVGNDGVLVVDTGLATMADKMLAAIKKISDRPLRYIINTHYHPDHTGGNEKIRLKPAAPSPAATSRVIITRRRRGRRNHRAR